MKERVAFFVLAALAAACIRPLFISYDSMPRIWMAELTRQEAAQEALKIAEVYMLDTTGWRAAYEIDTSARLAEARRLHPDEPLLKRFSALQYNIVATSPDRRRIAQVRMSNTGIPISFRRSGEKRPRSDRDVSPEEQQALARKELERFTGEEAGLYRPVAMGVGVLGGRRYSWEYAPPSMPGSVARFSTTIDGRRVQDSTCSLELRQPATLAYGKTLQNAGTRAALAVLVIGFAAALGALILFFGRLARRTDHVRFGLRLAALASVPVAAEILSGMAESRIDLRIAGEDTSFTASLLALAGQRVLAILMFGVIGAAGYALLGPTLRRKWVSLRLLLSRRAFCRPVGRDLLTGLIGGAALALANYVPAYLTAEGPVAQILDPDFVISRRPALTALMDIWSWDSMGLFAFLLPLGLTFRYRAAATAGVFAAGVLFSAALHSVYPAHPLMNLGVAALTMGGLAWIYRLGGLLAVLIAPVGTGVALRAFYFAVLTDEQLRAANTPIWASFLSLLGLCFVLALAGNKVDEQEEAEKLQAPEHQVSKPERERLKAEFGVARRAQQGMLPAHTPEMKGYRMAAVCEPAREVGGDFYDVAVLPGGKIGLCVADVSGKGVPAALYMTFVKGLLASAQTHDVSLPEMIGEINQHFLEAGKRRTFVTMALAVLEPETGRLDHVRAGHNPALLYRIGDSSCEFLMPRGIGIGITRRPVFAQTLESVSIEMKPGDTMVFYSDGLTEMMNGHRELFGEERLKEVVEKNAALDAESLRSALVEAVRRFRGAADPNDDLTIVVLQREPVEKRPAGVR